MALALAWAVTWWQTPPLAAQPVASDEPAAVQPWAIPRLAMTDLSGRGRLIAGARGGLTFGARFLLGGEGAALVGTVPVAERGEGSGLDLDMGYAGVVLGYRPLHGPEWSLSTTLLLGAGHATVTDGVAGSRVDAENFLVLGPEVSATWSARPWIGLALGLGYRLTREVRHLPGVRRSDLDGPALSVGVRLGR